MFLQVSQYKIKRVMQPIGFATNWVSLNPNQTNNWK